MNGRGEILEIKQLLQARIDTLVVALAPEGARNGRYWIARNPTRDDRNIGSFYIWLTGSPGAWRDDATGDKGDILSLIQYCQRLSTIGEALRWARGWLGLAEMPKEYLREKVVEARAASSARARDEEEKRLKNIKRALACFIESKKQPFVGSLAHRYLLTRGIDVTQLPRMPGVLGSLAEQRHHESDAAWPVMVAGFTGPDGKICAVHRTFLARNGSGKAPVVPARKIWPPFRGAAIRLWRGDSKLSIEDAAKQGLREALVIVEGVEDGLSVALALPEMRVWCAGSLGNLASLQMPECVDEVIVCADNDWGKPQAEAQLNKALELIAQQGRKVRVARSHVGKDANDALRGAA